MIILTYEQSFICLMLLYADSGKNASTFFKFFDLAEVKISFEKISGRAVDRQSKNGYAERDYDNLP